MLSRGCLQWMIESDVSSTLAAVSGGAASLSVKARAGVCANAVARFCKARSSRRRSVTRSVTGGWIAHCSEAEPRLTQSSEYPHAARLACSVPWVCSRSSPGRRKVSAVAASAGKERLRRKLRQCDVDRRSEHRRSADEAEYASGRHEPERHDHTRVVPVGNVRSVGTCVRIRGQLAHQLGPRRISGQLRSDAAAARKDAHAIPRDSRYAVPCLVDAG